MNKIENRMPKIPYASGLSRRVRTKLLQSLINAPSPYVNVDANNSPLRFTNSRRDRTMSFDSKSLHGRGRHKMMVDCASEQVAASQFLGERCGAAELCGYGARVHCAEVDHG